MVPVARRNLLAEKGRLAMSVAGVAFAVLLVLIVLSLYRGWSSVGQLISRLPGDVWITQEGTREPFHSTSFLPASARDAIARVPGVQAVTPMYARSMAYRGGDEEVNAFFLAIDGSGYPVSDDARNRYFPAPGHINIDSLFASKAGLDAGDTIRILGRDLTIERVVSGGDFPITQLAFLNTDDARAMFALGDNANYFLITTAPGAGRDAVGAAAAAAVPGAEYHTSEALAATISSEVDESFLPVVSALVGIGFIVGGAVIALTTYTATIERSREFGVLKALGASSMFLYRIVVTQSLIVGIVGSIVGIAASAIAASLIKRWIPEFITDLRWTDATVVLAAAIVMAIAASYVPARRINSIDPAMVFRA